MIGESLVYAVLIALVAAGFGCATNTLYALDPECYSEPRRNANRWRLICAALAALLATIGVRWVQRSLDEVWLWLSLGLAVGVGLAAFLKVYANWRQCHPSFRRWRRGRQRIPDDTQPWWYHDED